MPKPFVDARSVNAERAGFILLKRSAAKLDLSTSLRMSFAFAQSSAICALSASFGAEFHVLANEGDELDLHGLSVKIAIEIEQEDLKHRQARIEGRARAEIGRALQPPPGWTFAHPVRRAA